MVNLLIKHCKQIFVSTYIVIMIHGVVSSYINGQLGAVSLVYDRDNYYMDFFNIFADSFRQDFFSMQRGVYSPFIMSMIRVIFAPLYNGQNGFDLRHIYSYLGFLPHAIVIIISAYAGCSVGFSYTKDWWKSFSIGITVSLWPPLLFGLDRMNLIMLVYLACICVWKFIFTNGFASFRVEKKFKPNLKIIGFASLLSIATIIKPYLLLILLIFFCFKEIRSCMLTRKLPLFSNILISLIITAMLILVLNELPFMLGLYSGSVFSWIHNLIGYSSDVALNPWHVWNMSYNSLSIASAAKIFPETYAIEFLKHRYIANDSDIMWAYLLQGFFSLTLFWHAFQMISINSLITIDNKSPYVQSITPFIMGRNFISLLLISVASSVWFPQWGFYFGSLWVLVIVSSAIGVEKDREYQFYIVLALSAIYVTLASSCAFAFSPSLSSLFVLYSLMIFCSLLLYRGSLFSHLRVSTSESVHDPMIFER